MAVARGILGRPALLHSDSSTFHAGVGLAFHLVGFNARCSCPLSTCLLPRTGFSSSSGNFVDTREIKLASGRFGGWQRRDRGRGFFSMATAASDVLQTSAAEDDAEYKIQQQILAHQKAAARLPHLDEARTLVNQITSGVLSTISQKYDGFPAGSMVVYAADDDGSILLSISSLSPHTRDLEQNPKCSLLVPSDPTDRSSTTVTIFGEALRVPDQEEGVARATFLKKHPEAFWVDFGDFRFVRLLPTKVRYVSGLVTGLAAVADFTGKDFQAASVDPISQFAAPIAGHMNRDHADQTAQIVENSVGVKVESALIQEVDRFGFGVLAKRQGRPQKLRIPFPRPAEDRKDVKTLIIELLTAKTPLDK